jgi:hypothetical protein
MAAHHTRTKPVSGIFYIYPQCTMSHIVYFGDYQHFGETHCRHLNSCPDDGGSLNVHNILAD